MNPEILIGLKDPIEEEKRLANAIADSIELLFSPDIHVVSWRNVEEGLIAEISTHAFDPHKKFILKR